MVDIYLDEFSKELLGDILIGHIQFGGYTINDKDYMFGLYYDNIGVKYGTTVCKSNIIKINSFVQFDYAYSFRDRIISIKNIPVPLTSNSPWKSIIGDNTNKQLFSLGMEIEVPINKLISTYASFSQSITSYTKKSDIFEDLNYITFFELGMRFYQ
jgi:hypothetical protein